MRRHRRFCLVGLAVATLWAAEARAETVLYSFSATSYDDESITIAGEFSYYLSGFPSFSPIEGFSEFFTAGEFAYLVDDQWTVVSRETSENFLYEIWIVNGPSNLNDYGDSFALMMFTEQYTIRVNLANSHGMTLDTHLALPRELDLADWDRNQSVAIWGDDIFFSGRLDSLIQIPLGSGAGIGVVFIPEPGTLGLASFGAISVGILGWVRRRRAG